MVKRQLSRFSHIGIFLAATIICIPLLLVISFCILAVAAPDNEKKQLMVLFDAQSDFPAYARVQHGIKERLLTAKEFDIEYFVEYMDVYRNPDESYIQLLADIYQHKFSRTEVDLIISYGSKALDFLVRYGDRLFPNVPIVFAGVQPEQVSSLQLPPTVTGVLSEVDYAGLLDTALMLQPKTRNVAIVNGASKADLFFENKIREALQPYSKRVNLIYLTRLPFDELISKVKKLPSDTVILFYLLLQDGTGKGFIPKQAASTLAAIANAPIYGCLDSYLDSGIVGGRMLSMEKTGEKAGEMALRILRGEKPRNITISGEGTLVNAFDWRQLKRFGIPENHLPPDSSVQFKTFTFWESHYDYVVSAIVLMVLQSGFIIFLIHQRSQRRKAQHQLATRLDFEEILSSLSARFVNLPPDELDAEMLRVLESIGSRLEVDRVSVFVMSEETHRFLLVQSHTSSYYSKVPAEIPFAQVPWLTQKILAGELLSFRHLSTLPAEAEVDRAFLGTQNITSFMLIPLSTREKILGVLSFGLLGDTRDWLLDEVRQYRLIAEVFANAMMRRLHEEALHSAEKKYRTVADFTYDWEYWQNLDGTFEYISPSCERICGYTQSELTKTPSLFTELILSDDREVWEGHCHDACNNLKPHEVQFRIKRRDGQIRWLEHTCQPVIDDRGELLGFRASNRDISSRKQTEFELRRAYKEIEGLKNQLEAETAYLQEEIRLVHNYENIIGDSASLKYVLYKVEQIAPADTTVLVLGESGTGKELIARAIHNKSPRKNRALVKVNCATLPANLIESELFGYERGAFTGAQDRHLGRFEIADGATIFLDEIGELPLEMQAKLLRVLQEREFERLGSNHTIKVDVRIIAATNRDLEEEVRNGRFREDLFFRLNVFPITVPSLRQRIEDIPLLASHFTNIASKRLGKSIVEIPGIIMKQLQAYAWPGNVRELENVIERSVINSSGRKLRLAVDLKEKAKEQSTPDLQSLEEIERIHIERVLEFTRWRIEGAKGASQILDINPSTLRSRMRKLGIRKP